MRDLTFWDHSMMARSRRNWLERSGQAWKLTLADVGLFASLMSIVGGFALRKPGLILAGLAVGIPSVCLPFVIRCVVCGLRLMMSEEARTLPRGYRGDMLRTLEVCPVCRDDGRGTPDAVAAWIDAGRPRRPDYWNRKRVVLSAVAIVLAVALPYLVRVYWSVGAR